MSSLADSWCHDSYPTPTSDGEASFATDGPVLFTQFDRVFPMPRSSSTRTTSLKRKRHDCPFNLSTCTGCQSPPSSSPLRPPDVQQEPSPYPAESPESPRLEERARRTEAWLSDDCQDPQAIREQLVDQFLKLHFPAGDHDGDFMFTQFLSRDVLQAAGPIMQEAVDTLCLAEIGTSYRDRGLILEARKRYQACVAHLMLDAEDSETAKDDDSILGAIYILEFCGFYPALNPGPGDRKALHQAMEKLLLARGSKASYSKLVQLLLYNARHLDVMYGMVERKRCNRFKGKLWKQNIAVTNRLMADFTDTNLRVPFLLERCDEILRQDDPLEDHVVNLIIELSSLESRYQDWLLKYYSSFDGLPYWTVDADSLRHFQAHRTHAPDVFPKATEFPSFAHCSVQTTYWCVLLNIKSALLDLGLLLPFSAPLDRRQMLEQEAEECAQRLCESVPWIMQPQHGSCGALRATGPLYHARMWYAKWKKQDKVAWCREVFKSIQTSGVAAAYATFDATDT